MENNNTGIATSPVGWKSNHSHSHHHLESQSHKIHRHNDMLPSTSILLIIIPIIIIILLIAISLLIVMLKRIQSAKDNGISSKSRSVINNSNCMFIAHSTINIHSSPEVKGGCLHGGSSGRMPQPKLRGVQVFTYKELEMSTDKFSEANVIGNGGYGVVYKGVLTDGTVAAIKVLQREGKQWERSFRLEVDLLSRLHSPYLVELLGYCADQQHRLLIFDYMPNGSLQQHLHSPQKQSKNSLNWGVRLRIALDCARALEYMHEHTTPSVIHRDFKCSNVLLDQDFRAKVSDFGLAKIGSDKINGLISTRVLGTTGYLAPEYASTGKLTTKSDVYSYGVVLLELLTGRVPIDTKRPPGEHVLVSWALPRLTNREKVVEMVDPTLEGQYTKKDLIQVAAIAAMCVQTEADYRPLMTDVVQSLIPLVKTYSSSCPSNSFRCNQTVSPRS
ncbi:putative serine/threonine-protein kinase PBL7 [Nicotiana tabacum]|uniref:Serine/threonine-protein kinase CDL1 n=2 Tax=Nicotiana TaxID=4085 RepID=A0A1S3YTW7_TOBAC|nr:PREDICTED: pto-interacting protein 1 [Nicotiana sylvestris]XP_016455588.1 PREDICTED: serine/threonine-protein kinase CDL1-like [Nicotiana tabacum]